MLDTRNNSNRKTILPKGVHKVKVISHSQKIVSNNNGEWNIIEVVVGNQLGQQTKTFWPPNLDNLNPKTGESLQDCKKRVLKNYSESVFALTSSLFEGDEKHISGSSVETFNKMFFNRLNTAISKGIEFMVINTVDERNPEYSSFPKFNWVMPLNTLPNGGFVLSKYDLGTSPKFEDNYSPNNSPSKTADDLPF